MKQFEHFSRNPLGIIAFFVFLIYGIAGFVISSSFSNLHGESERLPLIWFIVIFPFVVLGVFFVLVVWFNEKLYAPKDYDNQEGFLVANGKLISPHKDTKTLERPEIIPVMKNNHFCMMSFSKPDSTMEKMLSEAALKKYSDEHELDIATEVRVSKGFICDGIAEKAGRTYLFEVNANSIPISSNALLNKISRIKGKILEAGLANLYIVVILISEEPIEAKIIDKILKQARVLYPNLDFVNYAKKDICQS